jgi:tetratricopeptide (TPR) repeat protein
MDLLYESFNSDLGPANPKMITAIQLMTQYEADTSMANRDLVYLLKFYIDNCGKLDLALKTIERLKELYNQRFASDHGLILLFQGETYLDLGNKNEARPIFEKILKIDTSFVPALVYDYKLETDKKALKGKLKILKKEYSDHWLVKKL